MARIKRSVNALKKRRKVMKLAKGYWGAKSKPVSYTHLTLPTKLEV